MELRSFALATLLFLSHYHFTESTQSFTSIAIDAINSQENAKIAAFTDLNADKITDLLMVSLSHRDLRVTYGAEEGADISTQPLLLLNDTDKLSTVVPGDFNGDLVTDFLLIYEQGTKDLYRLQLCIGSKSTLHYVCQHVTDSSNGQPMILDYNGDMRPDILMENPEGNMTLLVYDTDSREFNSSSVDSKGWGAQLNPHSNAFVDMNRDLAADIVLTRTAGILIILNKNGVLDLTDSSCMLSWPAEVQSSHIGMLSFIDYDADSYMDILMSATADDVTHFYAVSGWELNPLLKHNCQGKLKAEWNKLDIQLSNGNTGWRVSATDSWLRTGDVDNDGYPDLLVTLVNNDNGDTRPHILLNTLSECNGTCTSDDSRTFSTQWDWLPVEHNITQAVFYDMYHNGMLDILYNADVEGTTQLQLLENNVAKQACFVSVKVGSGLCIYNDSGNCNKPYANIVGPTVRYDSTHPDGTSANGIATQLTQSTNGAIQIPYVMFGLGTTPNFVDSLTIGVARQKDQSSWTETWTTIIPNSHLIVVPKPPNQPDQWLIHLSVTPSHLVLVTGLILLGLCALIAVVIAILHVKEKYQDRKLKLQEAQKFHFNAM